MLDLGARGLIVPNITTVKEVEELVSSAKFPPLGKRGYYPNRTSGWGVDPWAQDIGTYMEMCNRRCKLVPQCETQECLDQIEEITAVPGVDGIFVGLFDLSITLGVPMDFESPVLTRALDRILLACKNNGKGSMMFTTDPGSVAHWLHKGFDSVTCGLDTSFLMQGYQGLVDACQSALLLRSSF